MSDNRGTLIVYDKFEKFDVKRFYIIECIENMWRGEHYHKSTTQLISVVKGRIEVSLIGRQTNESFEMSIGDMFLQLPYHFFTFRSLEPTSSILVLCDQEHDQLDYYTQFEDSNP